MDLKGKKTAHHGFAREGPIWHKGKGKNRDEFCRIVIRRAARQNREKMKEEKTGRIAICKSCLRKERGEGRKECREVALYANSGLMAAEKSTCGERKRKERKRDTHTERRTRVEISGEEGGGEKGEEGESIIPSLASSAPSTRGRRNRQDQEGGKERGKRNMTFLVSYSHRGRRAEEERKGEADRTHDTAKSRRGGVTKGRRRGGIST